MDDHCTPINREVVNDPWKHVVGVWKPIEQPDISNIVARINEQLDPTQTLLIPTYPESKELIQKGYQGITETAPRMTEAQFIISRIGHKPRFPKIPEYVEKELSPLSSEFKTTEHVAKTIKNDDAIRKARVEHEDLCKKIEHHNFLVRKGKSKGWLHYLYNAEPPIEHYQSGSYHTRQECHEPGVFDYNHSQWGRTIVKKPPAPRTTDPRFQKTEYIKKEVADRSSHQEARLEHHAKNEQQRKQAIEQQRHDVEKQNEAIRQWEQKAHTIAVEEYPKYLKTVPRVLTDEIQKDPVFQYFCHYFGDDLPGFFHRYRRFDLNGYRDLLGELYYERGAKELGLLFAPRWLAIEESLVMQGHSFISGMTGSGKSVLLITKALQTIKKHSGKASVMILDPHNSVTSPVVRNHRVASDPHSTFYFDLSIGESTDRYPRFNLFDVGSKDPKKLERHVDSITAIFQHLCGNFTDLMASLMQYSVKLLLVAPGDPPTLVDLLLLLSLHPSDPKLKRYLKHADKLTPTGQQYFSPKGTFSSSTIGATKNAVVSRLQVLLKNDTFYKLTCQYPTSSFRLEDLILEHKNIIFSLAQLSQNEGQALGRMILGMLTVIGREHYQNDALRDNPPAVHCIVDEAQNYVSQSTETILTELRKSRKILHLACQFEGQGTDMTDSLRDAMMSCTLFKYVGNNSPKQYKKFTEGTSLRISDLAQLSQGKFLFHCSQEEFGKPKPAPRIYTVPSMYASKKHYADETTFAKFLEYQLERYYWPDPDASTASAIPGTTNEPPSTSKPIFSIPDETID